MVMISAKENMAGLKIPFLAISIIPLDDKAPTKIPTAATVKIVFFLATLDPNAEFKKLTASLLTPTTRSETANKTSAMTIIK